MPEINSTLNQSISDGLLKYSLLEIMLHVIGNGLAAISGYTQLLQRAISLTNHTTCPPAREQQERWLSYLQTIRQRETLLNDFLAQLRFFSPETTQARFTQCVVQIDLVFLVQQVIERVTPLHQRRTIRTHLPGKPLYVLCDLLWMEVVLEHVINHTVDLHAPATPIDIDIQGYENPSTRLQEARIAIHITTGQPEPEAETRLAFERKEQNICRALCQEVLREHGGRLWHVQGTGPQVSVFLALPQLQQTSYREKLQSR